MSLRTVPLLPRSGAVGLGEQASISVLVSAGAHMYGLLCLYYYRKGCMCVDVWVCVCV